jgi:signal peptidase
MHVTPHVVADPEFDLPAGRQPPRRRRLRSLARALARIGAWAVIGAAGLALAVSVVVPRIAGAQVYTIETGSMQPDLPPGSLAVVRPAEAEGLGVGDVITYQLRPGEPEVVTHRIVAQGVDGSGQFVFWTRGDANSAVDALPVRPVQVRGELWYSVPYLGYPGALLSAKQRSLALAAAVAGLLGYALAMLVSAARDRRRAGR